MRRLAPYVLCAALVGGCATAADQGGAPSPTASAPTASAPTGGAPTTPPPSIGPAPGTVDPSPAGPASTAPPSRRPSPRPTAKPDPPHPVSVRALVERTYDGDNLRLGRSLGARGDYRSRRIVTFTGDGLTVSGVLFRPDGEGPFPVVVLNHGYIDPDVYIPGQGMRREQDYLAERGYAVLHVDYRGHASGDDDPDVDYELRLPYAVDTINAVRAVKNSDLDWLDKNRVAWMGRSMGGNVTLNALVAQPGLVDAAVLYASTSSRAEENFDTFSRDNDERSGTVRRIDRTYGLPEDAPEFWRAASPRGYLDRITEPILLHHGEDDDTCPIEWSEDIAQTLQRAGKDVEFFRYPGEGHTFSAAWERSMERTVRFLEANLG